VDSVAPDEPRRARSAGTLRPSATPAPNPRSARTLVLDGVFDLAAVDDLAGGQHADAHSTL
jgi:hypothetical protein